MGYSHFFTQKKNFTKYEWHSLTEFVEKLSHYKPTICGPDGTGHPLITGSDIMFNGDGGVGEAHETFHISRTRPDAPKWMENSFENPHSPSPYLNAENYHGFRFCKTNRKPYDTSVVACLIFIAKMNKDIMKITSDGNISDWHDGYHLCKAIIGLENLTIPELGG
jgi:hypothetical protein